MAANQPTRAVRLDPALTRPHPPRIAPHRPHFTLHRPCYLSLPKSSLPRSIPPTTLHPTSYPLHPTPSTPSLHRSTSPTPSLPPPIPPTPCPLNPPCTCHISTRQYSLRPLHILSVSLTPTNTLRPLARPRRPSLTSSRSTHSRYPSVLSNDHG